MFQRSSWLTRLFASPIPLLLGLFLLSLSIRLVGLDWDQGALYHPDERRIVDVSSPLRWPESLAEFLDADKSPLNPHFFRYGSLPIYTLSGVASLLSAGLGEPVEGVQRALVGRVLSAGFDSLSVLLLYLLGARLYSRRVGLLAALFTALAVLHIQQSHYFVVDIPMTTLVLATLYFSARLATGGGRWNGALAGLFLGLAMATKVSAAPLALPVLLAWALRPGEGGLRDMRRWAGGAAFSGAVASAVFLLTQPYVLLDFPAFLKDILEESGMASGRADLPYTRQYVATAPYWYHVQQLAVWGLGLPLGILAWLGLAFVAGRALWKRGKADLLQLAWVLPFFLLVGPLQAKFARYMLPLAPLLILFGAVLLWEARDWMARRWRRRTLFAYATIAFVLVATGAYAVAFLRVYAESHTATRMAQWVRENVPAGSTVAWEEWDEAPRGLYPPFRELQLRPYEPDDEFKLIDFSQRLEQADYVLLASQRLYGTIPRLPERYPLTTRYYEKLFNGELGFQVAHVEATYPNLFGVSLVDDTFVRTELQPPPGAQAPVSTPFSLNLGFADENYTVYDRPKLILFRKVKSLDAEEVQARLGPAPSQETVFPLLMEPDLAEAQRRGGTWLEIFQPGNLANRFAPVAWLLAFEIIALAGLPLGLFVFRALPDKGFLLTKVLAFLVVAYVTWLLASLRWMEFSRTSVVVAILLLGLLSLLAAWAQWESLRRFFRSHWRLLLTGELLFLSAYAAFVLVRAANPDLWEIYRGGEKPMDFAYLNAVTRSTFMPPYDPWFAGGFLNYYYFGQFMVAVLIRLTGIVPEVSYNLAVPLFFALSVGGAFSVSYNLAEAARRALPRPSPAWGPVLAGIGGAALMGVLGNLGGLVQLGRSVQFALTPAWEAIQASPERLGQALARTPELLAQATLGHQSYWDPSRMIPQSSPDIPTPITEFPFFTFLFADLHAHLLALPLTILAIGLALAAAFALGRRLGFTHLVGPILGLGLVVGALRATNAWDFPTYLALGAAAVAVATLARRDNPLSLLVWSGGTLAAVYLLSGVLWGPYLETNVAFYTKLVPSPEQTPLIAFLGIYALPLFLLVSVLALGIRVPVSVPSLSRPAPAIGLVPEAAAVGERPWRGTLAGLGLLAGVAALTFLGYATVALCLVLLTGIAGLVLFREAPLHHRFALLFAGTALALVAFVDLLAIDDHLVRMNTVFKLYLQAWVLLALAGGYFLWWLGRQGAFARLRRVSWRALWALGLVLLVLATAVYPLLATRARVADRFAPLPLTLDGMAYMDAAVYSDDQAPYWQNVGPFPLAWDKGGIRWLRENVTGSPVVLEASIPEYRWGSRVSVYTGLPTVIGWNWHQRQQKGVDINDWAVWRRQGDVQALYDSTSISRTRELLSEYNVEYIYVGPVERAYYLPEGLAKFPRMVGIDLALVYEAPREDPQVTIYRVVR